MKRREFITLLGGAAAWPLAARAQQPERVRRIGVLMVLAEDDPQSHSRITAFHHGLEKLGWTIGDNLVIDYRWGISDPERARAAAAELLSLSPDLLVANALPAARGAQEATRTVPIVFIGVSEPVAQGFAASLARPSGNVTGFTNFEPSIGGKWVEALKEIAPRTRRIAVIFHPASTSIPALFLRSIETAGTRLGIEVEQIQFQTAAELDTVVSGLRRQPDIGLLFPPDTFTAFHHKAIVALAALNRLPAIYSFAYFAASGGLISYGPDLADQFRRSAAYVDRILRGEKPGVLPVQQPTKFELVINLKTAKALDLEVPPTLLARADEVIE